MQPRHVQQHVTMPGTASAMRRRCSPGREDHPNAVLRGSAALMSCDMASMRMMAVR